MKKKKVLVGISLGLLFSLPVALGVIAFPEILPIKNTELKEVSVNGFFVGQILDKIPKDFVQIDNTGDLTTYEIEGTNLLHMILSDRDNKVTSIHSYYQDEKKESHLLAPSIDNLVVGKSSYNEVLDTYGNNYNKMLFSDAWEQVIIFKDSNAKLKLKCCFNGNILVCAFLEAY
ncbi:MAG: hypothetical protein FWH04_03785 [Oscillospiraceae bacterium]|nr:hypothetical protein [Oscillospiraceae bacterium]